MRPIVMTVTTSAAGSSTAMMRFDEWAPPGPIGVACVSAQGTATYTFQFSFDDPNSPTNPVAVGSMTWINSGIAAAAGSSAWTTLTAIPLWGQLVVTQVGATGGNVTATIVQAGVAPY